MTFLPSGLLGSPCEDMEDPEKFTGYRDFDLTMLVLISCCLLSTTIGV